MHHDKIDLNDFSCLGVSWFNYSVQWPWASIQQLQIWGWLLVSIRAAGKAQNSFKLLVSWKWPYGIACWVQEVKKLLRFVRCWTEMMCSFFFLDMDLHATLFEVAIQHSKPLSCAQAVVLLFFDSLHFDQSLSWVLESDWDISCAKRFQ